jgi:hypothetical protein
VAQDRVDERVEVPGSEEAVMGITVHRAAQRFHPSLLLFVVNYSFLIAYAKLSV